MSAQLRRGVLSGYKEMLGAINIVRIRSMWLVC